MSDPAGKMGKWGGIIRGQARRRLGITRPGTGGGSGPSLGVAGGPTGPGGHRRGSIAADAMEKRRSRREGERETAFTARVAGPGCANRNVEAVPSRRGGAAGPDGPPRE